MTREVPPSVQSAAPGSHARNACRWCGQPLSALARIRGDVCDAMDCRRRAADAQASTRRTADLDRVRGAAAHAWDAPSLASAPVLWLRHHDSDLVPPSPIDIAELREHLQGLEADAPRPPTRAVDDLDADPPTPAIGGQLCALCRGRCCRFGLHGKAFIEAHQLRGWLADRPDATWNDAVDHYLGYVAPEHLHSSCLFHAPTGCALPRERRSDVCNQFACEPLEQLLDIATAAPAVQVVVGIVASQVLRGAAVVTAQGSRTLPGLEAAD